MNFTDFPATQAQIAAGDPLFGGRFTGELTERERHLIGLAVGTTKGCPDCTAAWVKAATQAGIPPQVIQEAINLTAGINAGFVIRAAVKGCGK